MKRPALWRRLQRSWARPGPWILIRRQCASAATARLSAGIRGLRDPLTQVAARQAVAPTGKGMERKDGSARPAHAHWSVAWLLRLDQGRSTPGRLTISLFLAVFHLPAIASMGKGFVCRQATPCGKGSANLKRRRRLLSQLIFPCAPSPASLAQAGGSARCRSRPRTDSKEKARRDLDARSAPGET